jgi:DNA-binding transcriptional MocR family regulator
MVGTAGQRLRKSRDAPAAFAHPTDGETGAMRGEPNYRYQDVMHFITALVDNGTLPLGARAPSLRQICRQHRISLSTALQAYRLLEDHGVLEARPQSGYYVARDRAGALKTPAISRPSAKPVAVSVSAIRLELLKYARDPTLVPLGSAIPGAELLAAGRLDRFLARAARVRGRENNTYLEANGDPQLRHEIARRAVHWGQAIEPEDIVVTCGCTEAINLALMAVASPGDTIAIESPTYFGFLRCIEALHLKALELPTDAATGIDPAALAQALKSRRIAACLFASSFNNPLGCTMPDGKKLAVLDLLARHRVPLIEDDIYGDIYFGNDRPRPFMAQDRRGDVIYCSSFSKTVAPGYRIGWIVPGARMPKVLERKATLTLCTPALTQLALADFLSSGGYDSHLRRVRRAFQHNIVQMTRTIEKTFPAGTKVTRPAGGFVLWLELPRPLRSQELFRRALEKGICFVPGDVFSPGGRYNNCMRLSCGHPWDARIEKGVATLGALASAALP